MPTLAICIGAIGIALTVALGAIVLFRGGRK